MGEGRRERKRKRKKKGLEKKGERGKRDVRCTLSCKHGLDDVLTCT